MRFDCGETFGEKTKRLEKWNKWFAWYPVKIADHDCRWFETVERKAKITMYWGTLEYNWEYRSIK